jgi:hypothetical protein
MVMLGRTRFYLTIFIYTSELEHSSLIKKIETKLYTYFLLHLNELSDEQSKSKRNEPQ